MNLREVHRFFLYRSEQPNPEAFKVLANIGGVSHDFCVMSLRTPGEWAMGEAAYNVEDERKSALDAGAVEFVNVPIGESPWDAPTKEQAEQAIALLTDGRAWLLHCRRGCDRTGVIVACYRMRRQGWDKASAIAEAKMCGMSRLEVKMNDFLEDFQ